MNILIISHYAGSIIHGMEYRPYYLAREWVRIGHNVTIVVASFSHLHNKRPTINGKITEEEIEGIRYLWLKSPEYKGNGARRVLNMLTFSWQILWHKTKLLRGFQPDIVIASSPHPFIIFGAMKIARLSNAKLVFEVRDLWPLSLIEIGDVSPRHPFIFIMQLVENFAYHRADRVVSLLPKADIYMKEHGMASNKFVYLPNGIDVVEWQNNKTSLPLQHSEVLSKLRQNGCFIIGYTGAHGLANALDTLVEAAALLQNSPVAFVLVGQGPKKEALQNKAKEIGLTNIKFLSPVLKTSIPEILDSMDVLFIGWNKEPLYHFGVSPNKLMDYMMAAKPIIHAVEATNDSVAESGCGISVAPEDPVAIAEAVVTLSRMTREERDEMGLRGKEYVLANHDYRILAKRFLESIQ